MAPPVEIPPVPPVPPKPVGVLGSFKRAGNVVKEAGSRWIDDGCLRLGASLAYYTLFSLFPLLLVAITILGFFLGSDPATREHLLASVNNATSAQFRDLLDQTLAAMQEHQTARGVGAVVGIVTLFFGASGAFSELQFALNTIWRVKATTSKGIVKTVLAAIKEKGLSFAFAGAAAFVLLFSLMASTALSAFGSTADQVIPFALLWRGVEVLVSLTLAAGVFAVMFRMVPETKIEWRDVLWGAIVTAVLFSILKHALGWYLSHIGSYAAYGAVGAVLGLMTWLYVAGLVVFFGAEITRVYAEQAGSLAGKKDPGATTTADTIEAPEKTAPSQAH